ncbi:plasmid replication initiator protein [Streptomyces mayteni]
MVREFDTRDEPGARLAVRCGNRRKVMCEPCSFLHTGDVYQIMRSGLAGGKGVPADVAGHPRLFVTFTAPSFGRVHRVGVCHPERSGECEHGVPLGCGRRHGEDARQVGSPLCGRCYDYAGHVLWHAHLGELWSRTMRAVRRALAAAGGVARSRLGEALRLSFAKVAEYQRRGAVHLHAVLRLDGAGGPGDAPPAWATETVLTAAVRTAAGAIRVQTLDSTATGERTVRWGRQLDIHPIRAGGASVVDDSAVAAYVAKYVGKAVSDSGGTDYRVKGLADIRARKVTGHVRALMLACWRLGGLPEFEGLRLRAWAHTLGFRGHVLSKSRRYSTTFGELRGARSAFRDEGLDDEGGGLVREGSWRFVSQGHSPAEGEIARGVALDAAVNRAAARDAWAP